MPIQVIIFHIIMALIAIRLIIVIREIIVTSE